VQNAPEVYGVDTLGRSYRIFARPEDAGQGTLTLSTKLFDLGRPVEGSTAIRVGVDLSIDAPNVQGAVPATLVPLTVTLVSEQQALALPQQFVRFAPLHDSPLDQRFALYRHDAPMTGERLGVTVQIPAKYHTAVEAIHLEAAPTGAWRTVQPTIRRALFYNSTTERVHFVNAGGDPVFWVN
jgi:hypothetical protein